MKKRDKYWLIRLFQSLVVVLIFLSISLFNMVQFNHSYMEEEREELQVFTRQIEWAILPYLKNNDYENVKKYTSDFKNEDITISIFDAEKNLIATSKPDNSKKCSQKLSTSTPDGRVNGKHTNTL